MHARNTKNAPICGARRKDGTLCQAVQRCANGRCRNHGGLATGRPLVAGQIHTATMARLRAECDALARDEAALLNTVPIIAKDRALSERDMQKILVLWMGLLLERYDDDPACLAVIAEMRRGLEAAMGSLYPREYFADPNGPGHGLQHVVTVPASA